MCSYVICVIILILAFLIPASYMMGIVRGVAHERVGGGEGMACCGIKTQTQGAPAPILNVFY